MFEGSLIHHLSTQAARSLCDSHINESKWIRWENEPRYTKHIYPTETSEVIRQHKEDTKNMGRVLVACTVKFRYWFSRNKTLHNWHPRSSNIQGSTLASEIKYHPVKESSWSSPISVSSMEIIQYRSIERHNLFMSSGAICHPWNDNECVRVFLTFETTLQVNRALRCECKSYWKELQTSYPDQFSTLQWAVTAAWFSYYS